MKFVVITGGVISGIGKGITASSIGLILKENGYNITAVKIDPYLNVDAGTISPFEHGEVFVLEDGTETDLDLGNYERFLGINLGKQHNITGGRVFKEIIAAERKGDYLGETVQFIPHVTKKIQDMLENASEISVDKTNTPEICIVELGGTVGDMENVYFVEALRQLSHNSQKHDFCFIHTSLILKNQSEFKTKPTQTSVRELNCNGIVPNILILRCVEELPKNITQKISKHCQINHDNVFTNIDVDNIYQVPLHLNNQNISSKITEILKISNQKTKTEHAYIQKINNIIQCSQTNHKITVFIVGKYTTGNDAYLSVHRAIELAGYSINTNVKIVYVSSDNSQKAIHRISNEADAVIIPGGFGNRDLESMIYIARHCRRLNIPTLGICLGMQIMCIESARRILGNNCISSESIHDGIGSNFENTHQIISPITDISWNVKGGSMRLGNYETLIIKNNTVMSKLYGNTKVNERHRHRYEVNPKYVDTIKNGGLCVSAISTKIGCVDVVEDTNNIFYLGCQFHPEFKNYNDKPHPLFIELIHSSSSNKTKN